MYIRVLHYIYILYTLQHRYVVLGMKFLSRMCTCARCMYVPYRICSIMCIRVCIYIYIGGPIFTFVLIFILRTGLCILYAD